MRYFRKAWDSRISNMIFPCIKWKIYKYTITQINKYTNTKCITKIYIYIFIYITFINWRSVQSFFWTQFFSDEMTLPQALLVNATFKGLMLYHAVFSLLSGDSACKLDDKFKSTRTSYNSGIMTKFNWFTLVFWCSQICSV